MHELPVGFELLFERLEDGLEERVDALAGVAADEVPGGVDEDEGGPGTRAEGVPDGEVRVVDDRVLEAVLVDCVTD